MAASPYPTPQHERLAVLAGTWKTTGEIRPIGSDPGGKLEGEDSYEWLPGQHFLLHRVDVTMAGTWRRSVEIIGVDAARKVHPMRSFDDQGNEVVTEGVLDGRKWSITGDGMRFHGTIGEAAAVIEGQWERMVDGVWLPWIDVRLTRMS
jgi:hypothetical protein